MNRWSGSVESPLPVIFLPNPVDPRAQMRKMRILAWESSL